MKKILISRLLMLVAFISLATGCKKDNFADSEVSTENLSEASTLKKWYEQQPGVAAKGSPQNGTVDWNKTSKLNNGNDFITPVSSSGNSSVSKFLISSFNDGKVSHAKFLYVISLNQKNTESVVLMLAESNKIPNDFNGVVLEYDLTNKLIRSAHYEKGKIVNSKKDILSYKKDRNNFTSTTAKVRQCWGVYLNTYQDGILVYSQLLYTYCDQDTTDTIDPDGGGGNGGDNTITDSLQFNEQVWNQYIQKISTPAEITRMGQETIGEEDPNTGTFTWVVAEGLISHWRILANTSYSFYKTLYYNTDHFEYNYNLFDYHTTSTYYVGSNTAISSTWMVGTVSDGVFSNNTANTQGVSNVKGRIKHRLNITMPNNLPQPEVEDPIDNSAKFNPR